MKRFFSLLFSLVFCFSCSISAFALELDKIAEEVPAIEVPEIVETPSAEVPEIVETPSAEVPKIEESIVSDEEEVEFNPELGIEDGTLLGVSVLSVAPITPEDTTGLKSVLLQFIGDYEPIVLEYEYQNSNNQYSSYLREPYPDYVWFGSLLVLILMIYCLFRLGGAIFG